MGSDRPSWRQRIERWWQAVTERTPLPADAPGEPSTVPSALVVSSAQLGWLVAGLGPACRAEHASSLPDALELLATDHYDLIVLELHACDRPVADAVRAIRGFRQTPILLAAPRALREAVGQALRAGADEFVFTDVPPSPELVRHAVEHALLRRALRDVAATEADPVTGLLSAHAFQQLYEERRARSRLFGERFTVLRVQVLDLRRVEAAYGARSVELSLRHVAESLRRTVRSTDAVAHLGQGAFVAVLDNGDSRRVEAITERLHAAADAYRDPQHPELRLRVRVVHATGRAGQDPLAEAERKLGEASS
ncbi:hypothetical protein HRbin32_01952 [bacterium HR32]|nr:hypothetical protein HRbin32_01952 [bacterium HR32]